MVSKSKKITKKSLIKSKLSSTKYSSFKETSSPKKLKLNKKLVKYAIAGGLVSLLAIYRNQDQVKKYLGIKKSKIPIPPKPLYSGPDFLFPKEKITGNKEAFKLARLKIGSNSSKSFILARNKFMKNF